jgi:lipoprotein-releasing system permease protein
MEQSGWQYRRQKAFLKQQRELIARPNVDQSANPFAPSKDSDDKAEPQGRDFDMATEQHTGIVLGIGVCGFRGADGADHFVALPGDDVRISFPKASLPPEAISEFYTIVDFYESKMSEYDSNFVFVPLQSLQKSRGMIDPEKGIGKFTSIQIKLRPGANAEAVRDKLRNAFPAQFYAVSTWRDKQGPLLAAVQMETAVLNVLLFMIIAVAGFGILAIFYMIVVEKTRDIGILKSLGASGSGVMGIFLGYGLSLGIVGSGVGLIIGLAFVANINEIADLLGRITGQPVFDPSVYYFYKIPTIVEPFTVTWICLGAVAIAVLASVLPARRAAHLHPVRALRYE